MLAGALLLAGCATGGDPGAAPTGMLTPSSSPSALPEGPGAPTPSATTGEPTYYAFDGSWERFRVTGVFCTEDDASFIGSPQGVTEDFQDPGFSFFRNGTVYVSGTKDSMPGSFLGFGGEGHWDFLIGLDGRPAGIYGTIAAGYRTGGVGPGSGHEFSADLDIDVTPRYDDEFSEYCEATAARG